MDLRGRVRGSAGAAAAARPGSDSIDKLVFITGASSGIGQALAWRYHQAGWRLALVARRTGEIESWARAQGLGPDRYAVYGADVADTRQHRGRRPGLPGAAGRARRGDRQRRHQRRRGHGGARRPGRDRAHLRHQQRRPGRHFPSVRRRPWSRRGSGAPGGHRQRRRHPRAAGSWRLLRQQGGGDQLLREPARRTAALAASRW